MSVKTIKQSESPTHIQSQLNDKPLPLHSRDRLPRAEFERRYEAHPEIKKAELIEGVVYVSSPIRYAQHADPHFNVSGLNRESDSANEKTEYYLEAPLSSSLRFITSPALPQRRSSRLRRR
jgi:hypothetical protein